MATYYDELKKTIENNQKDLDRLYLEKRALYLTRRSWTKENYQNEEFRIDSEIEKRIKAINENQTYLSTYYLVDYYIGDLKPLTNLYNNENDPKIKDEISNQFLKRVEYINKKMDDLPVNLNKELREKYISVEKTIEDKKLVELEEEKTKLLESLESAFKSINSSTSRLNNIIDEEKFIIEGNNLFKTEEELDNFNLKYMNKKILENERLLASKKNKDLIEKRIKILDKKINQRREIVELSKKININPDDYENIINRINRRSELDNFFNRLGLSDLVEKREKLFNQSAEELKKNKEIVKNKLLEERIARVKRSTHKVLPSSIEIKPLVKENTNKEKNKEVKVIKRNEPVISTKPKYTYDAIINNLVKGLDSKKLNGKRYRINDLEVSEKFKDELSNKSFLYNVIHVVPNIIKLPVEFIKNECNKLSYSTEGKGIMKIIDNRLDNLSKEELWVLVRDYSKNSDKYPTGLNLLIEERIKNYSIEEVKRINKDLDNNYKDVFNTVRELDTINILLSNKNLSKGKRDILNNYSKKIISGKSEVVSNINVDLNIGRDINKNNKRLFLEDSRVNYIEERINKNHEMSVKSLEKELKVRKAMDQAIKNNDDEMALRCFVSAETLLYKNNKSERKVSNKINSKEYYSPLAKKLDYKNDAFTRDILREVVMTSAIINNSNILDEEELTKYNNIKASIEELVTNYASFEVSQTNTFNILKDLSINSYSNLTNVVQNTLTNVDEESRNTLKDIINNPNNIINNYDRVESRDIILNACTTALLSNVYKTINKNKRKGNYSTKNSNSLDAILEDYKASQESIKNKSK